MHETARHTIFSTQGSASQRSALLSTTTEDANAPMLLHAAPAPMSSEPRHYVSEDNDEVGAITSGWSCGRLTRNNNRI
jgi:hypothetical protein